MYYSARSNGIDGDGLVFDELTSDMNVLKRSHRLWPHAEAAKAAVVRHLRGDREAPRFASMMICALIDNFLDRPFAGGWIDHVNIERKPLVDYVPASSLYHLLLATTELARTFKLAHGK